MQLDRLLDTVKERPGSAILVTCAGAAVVGFLCGRTIYKSTSETEEGEDGEQLETPGNGSRQYRQTTSTIPDNVGSRMTDDYSRPSGASSPQSSIAGTPRKTSANELSGELETLFAIVYRSDLQMEKGMLATLSAQAAIAQYKQLHRTRNADFKLWEKGNRSKVCLQCPDEEQILDLREKAQEKDVMTFKVSELIDGRRQVAVLAVGPAKVSTLRALTSHLQKQP